MKKIRKVALLLPNFVAAGTQRAQLLVAKGLIEIGSEVDVVVARSHGSLAAEVPARVRTIMLGGTTEWSPVGALSRYLQEAQPDHLLSALNPTNLLALRASRRAGTSTRLAMSLHNHFEEKWRNVFTPSAPLRRLLFRWMYQRSNAVVTVSNELRQYLITSMRLDPKSVHVIENPVDSVALRALSEAPVEHPWLAPDSDSQVLIGVGRLTRQKDFATLIQALRSVRESRPARLLLLGEGEERSALESLCSRLGIRSAVDFVGFQANPYAWMRRSDLLVLSSRWEGYPLVLLEALALGGRIVATDCPSGPREILKRFQCGLLCPVGDVSQMASAIHEALDGRCPLPSAEIFESLSPANVAQRYLNFFAATTSER